MTVLNKLMKNIKSYLYTHYLCVQVYKGKMKLYRTPSTKKSWRRYLDVLRWMHNRGEFCSMYNAWGLNSIGSEPRDFIGRREFLRLKRSAEKILAKLNLSQGLNYDVLTKDKFVAGSFLLGNNRSCIPHLGIIKNGVLLPIGVDITDLFDLLRLYEVLVLKQVALEAGEGVIECRYDNGIFFIDGVKVNMAQVTDRFSLGMWLIQQKIQSHFEIRRINSTALNTTRIVTIINNGRPEYLCGFQAFATGNSSTDSWHKGSVYVGIDPEKSCLKDHGYYNLSFADRSVTNKHPNTLVEFSGYEIPFLKEAIDLCLNTHSLFYNNFILGWDIAITDTGPLIVEVNEKPGMNVVQCFDGGLRSRITERYKQIINKGKQP